MGFFRSGREINGYDWSPEALHADMLAAGALTFEGVAA
jgi:hypothetical protein